MALLGTLLRSVGLDKKPWVWNIIAFVVGGFVLWLGIMGIITERMAWRRYEFRGLDAQIFGAGVGCLAVVMLLIAPFDGSLLRFKWVKITTAICGVTFVVCTLVTLYRVIF